MSQTNYDEQGLGLVGSKYALVRDERVLSYAAEVAIPYGRFCALGTDKDEQVKLPTAAADITGLGAKRGVALQSHARENLQDGLDPQYDAKETVSVMTKGAVYVEVEQDVVPGDSVFVRFADDGGGAGATDKKGIFRKDADDSVAAAAAELANARWLRSSETSDGKKIAVLELL